MQGSVGLGKQDCILLQSVCFNGCFVIWGTVSVTCVVEESAIYLYNPQWRMAAKSSTLLTYITPLPPVLLVLGKARLCGVYLAERMPQFIEMFSCGRQHVSQSMST